MNTRITSHMTMLALLAALSFPVSAQYAGPNGETTTARDLQGSLMDRFVTLKGTITRRLDKDLYEFDDGTGKLLLDIDHKKSRWPWPEGGNVDHKTPVEIHGKYVGKALGWSKVKVIEIRFAR